MPAPEMTAEDRIIELGRNVAGIARLERKEIIDALQLSDADAANELCAVIQFEDLLRIDDRGLQSVL